MTAPIRGVPAKTIDGVRDRLADVAHPPTRSDVARALAEVAGPLREEDREATRRVVTAELLGAGPLDELLADPSVTDVLVNGPAEVWVDRGRGLERADVWFTDDDTVRRLATRLAASGGRRLDAAAPFADARLADGTRLHAVLAPVAIGGTCLSLRRPRRVPIGLAEFVTGDAGDAGDATGTLLRRSAGEGSAEAHTAAARPSAAGGRSVDMAARRDREALVGVLRALVDARLAIAVTGGTGTGKTTLLAALLGCVSPAERVVIVEDTTELALERDNLVRLQGRPPNIEGAGAITQRDLVRQALRMRPDRLVVGEVRGPEVLDLLVAFNTGHEGGLTTVHGNAPGALPARMEALGALAGLSRAALHSLLAAAVQVTVHLRRDDAGRRVVAAVAVLRQDPGGLVRVRPALVATPPAPPEAPGGRMLPADGLPWLRDLLRDRGVALPSPFGSRP
ncbi:CpaF family protein [Pseudofrankia asymbiotica]|uniref:CpaF family protein n=1 Tax=Pseudofrankia asymbiotica TaxID=1834516 RepID=UPI000975E571|nr:ATPase, T2SS/T4P/T4SS family [Pseudofrankia asymbiotica]